MHRIKTGLMLAMIACTVLSACGGTAPAPTQTVTAAPQPTKTVTHPAPTLPQVLTLTPSLSALPSQTWTPPPTTTPLPLPSATATLDPLLALHFPAWVSDPQTDVLLLHSTPPSDQVQASATALVNASTGERFNLPELDVNGSFNRYFWTPDGKHLGMVTASKILLFNLGDSSLTSYAIEANMTRFLNNGADSIPLYLVNSNTVDAPDFVLIDRMGMLSFDGKYLLVDDHTADGKYAPYVVDLATGDKIQVVDPASPLFADGFTWSPAAPYLAVTYSNKQLGLYNTALDGSIPTFTLGVYDIVGQKSIANLPDISYPEWSPDGTKLLAGGCIYDWKAGLSDCLDQIRANHRGSFYNLHWSPHQTAIGYVINQAVSGKEQGKICYLTLEDNQENCLLQEFISTDHPYRVPINFEWAPGGKFISLIYADSCTMCDYWSDGHAAIANVLTGKITLVGDASGPGDFNLGLWRPATGSG